MTTPATTCDWCGHLSHVEPVYLSLPGDLMPSTSLGSVRRFSSIHCLHAWVNSAYVWYALDGGPAPDPDIAANNFRELLRDEEGR